MMPLSKKLAVLLCVSAHIAFAYDLKCQLTTSRVGFGSCSSPKLPQPIWHSISRSNISHFMWHGDVIYAKGKTISDLEAAWQTQQQRPEFHSFQADMRGRSVCQSQYLAKPMDTGISAIWDDHDFGINDASGAELSPDELHQRQTWFANAMQWPPSALHESRKGLYYDTLFSLPYQQQLHIITLDTRSFKEANALPSIGGYTWFPYLSKFAATIRYVCSAFGVSNNSDGAILGQEQWSWLEKQLEASTADMVVIVSSIQVDHCSSNERYSIDDVCQWLLGADREPFCGELGSLPRRVGTLAQCSIYLSTPYCDSVGGCAHGRVRT
eukprot:m.126858 g.126858  ORF g.126858 m.126858 type:complete len:325 (-) comp15785_c0_seq1:175-1149(-)